MSISLVFGLPRCGKTTYLTYIARRALRKKKNSVGCLFWKSPVGDFQPYERVYTNFPVAGCYQLDFDKLGIEQFENCLIVIDEIMLLCDSRDWKNYAKHLRDFMALHGHYRVDIVAASQSYKDCDLRIRNLAERLLWIQKIGSFSRISPIKKTWAIEESIEEAYQLGSPISSVFIYRPLVYKYFDSFAAPQLENNTAEMWNCGSVSAAPEELSESAARQGAEAEERSELERGADVPAIL